MTEITHIAAEEPKLNTNFIHSIIDEDIHNGKNGGHVITRFPPEPNGYLHIGHAKSICLNFGTARKYNGKCNLRFDDTNPVKEETEYVDAIKEDIQWLGFQWDNEFYASDYFDQLYQWAIKLIYKGKAYVCELTQAEIARDRGMPQKPATPSPFRERPVKENLELFERMRKGGFPDGSRTLRAKIDLASPNMHMRDPVLYRILHADHHRTGNKWCIYPMYDYAHGQSDSIEGITHSICTLEFEVHRPLYDWLINELEIHAPQQIEFARLNIDYTIMSKRKLLELVKNDYVAGWDDPRMPTICGLRRRGYTPVSIRNFAERVGVAKRDNMIELSLLEFCIREDLNKKAARVMGVLHPLKVVIVNFPENEVDLLEAINNPEDETMGVRQIPFTREIYIERDDFTENPPKKYFRLAPGAEVRLRYAYLITCNEVVKDADGDIVELHCSCDPDSRGGQSPDGRKVKGTIHWVSAQHAIPAEVRLYDRLFTAPNPDDVPEGADYKDNLNPDSLRIVTALIEPCLKDARPGTNYQFERLGYFCVDPDTTADQPVFNRTVTLKDSWAKQK